MGKAVSIIGYVLLGLPLAVMALWAGLALYLAPGWSEGTRLAAVLGFAAAVAAIVLLVTPKSLAVLAFLGLFALVAVWWSGLEPDGSGGWQPDVARLPSAQVQGDTVTVRGVRDILYRTETDYTPNYHDKTYDLKDLDSVDLIAVYWAGEAIAHVMVSFGFAGKDYLCFSIETRKRDGQDYSTWRGFFKQYGLIYVAALERDLIRLRTDYRQPNEDVYLFRTRMPRRNMRELFLQYLKRVNELHDRQEFYNTLTSNCTTDAVRNVRAFGGRLDYDWRVVFSGYMPEYLYRIGALDTSLPYRELRERSHVNARARAIGDAPDFSARLREGLPGFAPPAKKADPETTARP